MYDFFVILHILSAGVVIGLVTNGIVGTVLRNKVRGTVAELGSIRMAAIMSPILASIGSIGLAVSGIVMTIMHYSWFPFASLPWLAMMQTDFLVIMAIAGSLLTPRGKKILAKASAELSSPTAVSGASPELRKMVNTQYAVTLIVGLLVLLAVVLGETKSLMWVGAQ